MNNPTLDHQYLAHIGDYGPLSKLDLDPICPCSANSTVSDEDLDRAGIWDGKLTIKIYQELRRIRK